MTITFRMTNAAAAERAARRTGAPGWDRRGGVGPLRGPMSARGQGAVSLRAAPAVRARVFAPRPLKAAAAIPYKGAGGGCLVRVLFTETDEAMIALLRALF